VPLVLNKLPANAVTPPIKVSATNSDEIVKVN